MLAAFFVSSYNGIIKILMMKRKKVQKSSCSITSNLAQPITQLQPTGQRAGLEVDAV